MKLSDAVATVLNKIFPEIELELSPEDVRDRTLRMEKRCEECQKLPYCPIINYIFYYEPELLNQECEWKTVG